MARLVWAGLGAVAAVVAVERARPVARRYAAAAVSQGVEAAGRRTRSALEEAVTRFHTARATREQDLVRTLLVTPDGGDPHAVLRRGRHEDAAATDAGRPGAAQAVGSLPAGSTAAAGLEAGESGIRPALPPRPSGRVDPDEPLNDF